jgi:hypothetical protein
MCVGSHLAVRSEFCSFIFELLSCLLALCIPHVNFDPGRGLVCS